MINHDYIMCFNGAKKGMIITFDQEDERQGIKVLPAWKWMTTETSSI